MAISRFTRTLSTLLAGGIPIVRALDVSKHVAANVILGEAVDAARTSLTEGATLAAPLRASGEFPALVVHMVDVGERSGALEAMLGKVADTYDEQVETSVTRLTALLEPLLARDDEASLQTRTISGNQRSADRRVVIHRPSHTERRSLLAVRVKLDKALKSQPERNELFRKGGMVIP